MTTPLATLDLNRPVQTRDGDPVTFLTTDFDHRQPLVGYATYDGGRHSSVMQWDRNGNFYSPKNSSPHDLINVPLAPKTHTVRLALREATFHPGYTFVSPHFDPATHSSAIIATKTVEFVEGVFE